MYLYLSIYCIYVPEGNLECKLSSPVVVSVLGELTDLCETKLFCFFLTFIQLLFCIFKSICILSFLFSPFKQDSTVQGLPLLTQRKLHFLYTIFFYELLME